MTTLRSPYMKYLITPEGVKPAQYVHRPVVTVMLSIKGPPIPFDGLIDSGADECTFPGWIVKSTGRDVHRGKKRIFKGIGGSVLAYQHKTRIHLDGVTFLTDVYYSHEWDDMPFGLLGQAGFFSRFDAQFRYKKKAIVITR